MKKFLVYWVQISVFRTQGNYLFRILRLKTYTKINFLKQLYFTVSSTQIGFIFLHQLWICSTEPISKSNYDQLNSILSYRGMVHLCIAYELSRWRKKSLDVLEATPSRHQNSKDAPYVRISCVEFMIENWLPSTLRVGKLQMVQNMLAGWPVHEFNIHVLGTFEYLKSYQFESRYWLYSYALQDVRFARGYSISIFRLEVVVG